MPVYKYKSRSGAVRWGYMFSLPDSTRTDCRCASKGGFLTKRDAEDTEARRRIEEQKNIELAKAGSGVAAKPPTALTTLLEEFFSQHVDDNLAPKTAENCDPALTSTILLTSETSNPGLGESLTVRRHLHGGFAERRGPENLAPRRTPRRADPPAGPGSAGAPRCLHGVFVPGLSAGEGLKGGPPRLSIAPREQKPRGTGSPAPRNGVRPFLGGLSVLLAIDGLRSVLDPLKGFFRRHRIVEVMQALPILTLVGV
jgi:hypothetical protein